jgi:Tfp pilus assembly protein PilV
MLQVARGRLKAASQDGFALMEVIVSAAVLVIVVLGVLAGIDALSRTASANQSRTVAATLGEKDLERLRAYRTEDLTNLAKKAEETSTVTVGKITYTIVSKVALVADTTGEEVSCSVPTGKGRYLRITSTVSGGAAKPVVMSSIVAPQPNKGTLTALVHNARDEPVEGIAAEAVGPSPSVKTTNALGCAIFDESEAGSYTLRLNQTGWVNVDGLQLYEQQGTVSPGNVTTVQFKYDKAGSFPVTVVNSAGQTEPTKGAGTVGFGLMADHTGVTTGFRSTNASPFTSMFPFYQAPYEVYSGDCTGNNPSSWINGYYDTHPLAVAQVDPGVIGPMRTVLEPSVNVTVNYKANSGSGAVGANGATVYAYPRTAGCKPGRVAVGTINGSGVSPTPGLPFGEYDLCIQYSRSDVNKTWRAIWTRTDGKPAITNTNPAGTSKDDAGNNLSVTFVGSNSSSGSCQPNTPTT